MTLENLMHAIKQHDICLAAYIFKIGFVLLINMHEVDFSLENVEVENYDISKSLLYSLLKENLYLTGKTLKKVNRHVTY